MKAEQRLGLRAKVRVDMGQLSCLRHSTKVVSQLSAELTLYFQLSLTSAGIIFPSILTHSDIFLHLFITSPFDIHC